MEDRSLIAIVMALVAASSWGFSAVLVRMGLGDVSTALGTLISLISGLLFTAVLVTVFESEALGEVSLEALVLFGLIGLLNFPVGRFFNYMAMDRLGVGRSTPILASAPLFAVLIAVVATGEELQAATAVGIAFIVGGLYLTVTARTG